MEQSEIGAAFGEAGAAEGWAPGTVMEPLTAACAETSSWFIDRTCGAHRGT